MTVTMLEPLPANKYKVYVDGVFAFALYKGELSRFHLEEGAELAEELFQEIRKEVVLRRAKLRAMHLLNDMDRTESQLLAKLRQNHYPEDIAGEALAYVKSFGYVEDSGYARRFVEGKKGTKSRRELCAKLSEKGVKREDIDRALEMCCTEEDEVDAIRRLARKRNYHPGSASMEEKRKQTAYFMRKGFRYEQIRKALEMEMWD